MGTGHTGDEKFDILTGGVKVSLEDRECPHGECDVLFRFEAIDRYEGSVGLRLGPVLASKK